MTCRLRSASVSHVPEEFEQDTHRVGLTERERTAAKSNDESEKEASHVVGVVNPTTEQAFPPFCCLGSRTVVPKKGQQIQNVGNGHTPIAIKVSGANRRASKFRQHGQHVRDIV